MSLIYNYFIHWYWLTYLYIFPFIICDRIIVSVRPPTIYIQQRVNNHNYTVNSFRWRCVYKLLNWKSAKMSIQIIRKRKCVSQWVNAKIKRYLISLNYEWVCIIYRDSFRVSDFFFFYFSMSVYLTCYPVVVCICECVRGFEGVCMIMEKGKKSVSCGWDIVMIVRE